MAYLVNRGAHVTIIGVAPAKHTAYVQRGWMTFPRRILMPS